MLKKIDNSDYINLLYSSYIIIRKSIGCLGVFLPIILIFGGLMIKDLGVAFSLSAYYHNRLGDIFVLIMGASGMLLIAYRGREPVVRIMTTVGGALALLIIVFPTNAPDAPERFGLFNLEAVVSGWIHMVCAIAFFAVLGFVSFNRFRDHEEGAPDDRKKLDKWYKLFGLTLYICSAIYLFVAIILKGKTDTHIILALETIGLVALGLTWLIKGSKKIS